MLFGGVIMLNYRPKMFDEASKSHASKKLFVIILCFIAVFIVVLVLESLVSGIVSWTPMKEALADADMEHPWAASMEASKKVMSDPKIMVPTLIGTVFGTLTAMFYCRFIEMRPIRSMGAVKKRCIPDYLIGIVIGAALMTAIVAMSNLTGASKTVMCDKVEYGTIALFLLGFFVQGMSEEFIFRGYLLTTIGGAGYHTAVGVGITSVGFALAHASNPGFGAMPFINLTMFGVFAALYMILTDSIWGVSAIHSIWNFTQGNLYGISVSGSADTESVMRTSAVSEKAWLTGGEFGIEGSIFTTVALGIGIAAVFFLLRKKAAKAAPAQ